MIDENLLRAVVDQIIPGDADPGAISLGTMGFVQSRLAANARDEALIAAGLAALDASAGGQFAGLGAAEQIARLEAVETEPWFERLVTLTSEGYYADPGNGGNAGAKSWTMMGYRHGLPEGPDGPPAVRSVK